MQRSSRQRANVAGPLQLQGVAPLSWLLHSLCIYLLMHLPLDASTSWCIYLLMHLPLDASTSWCMWQQGLHNPCGGLSGLRRMQKRGGPGGLTVRSAHADLKFHEITRSSQQTTWACTQLAGYPNLHQGHVVGGQWGQVDHLLRGPDGRPGDPPCSPAYHVTCIMWHPCHTHHVAPMSPALCGTRVTCTMQHALMRATSFCFSFSCRSLAACITIWCVEWQGVLCS